jgi:hypothetical protein
MSSFRLHLYNAAPTAIADNVAFNLISADRAKYMGYIDVDTIVDMGDTLWGQVDNVNLLCKTLSTTIYGVLETKGAFTPSSGTIKTVSLKVVGV